MDFKNRWISDLPPLALPRTLRCKVIGISNERPPQGAGRHRKYPPAAGGGHAVPRLGPSIIALTGLLAFVTAAAQAAWYDIHPEPIAFFGAWVSVAVVSAALIGLEMLARTRRHHGGLADAVLFNAVEHFLPFGAAGAVIGAILLRFAPDTVWMLPGLWQMLIGLGLFAGLRFLPRSVAIAGAWYFLAGAAVLMMSSATRSLSPWAMGVTFGAGQLLMAAILHLAHGGDDVESR
jgi:hypothetical protein